jgi:uncharacterized SAM-binding protein YcdF (DUF218 family)
VDSLVFTLFKVLDIATQPLAWVVLLCSIAALFSLHRPVLARRASIAGLTLLLVTGWNVPPVMLLRTLEDRYEVPGHPLDRYTGIVVLGGGIEPPHETQGRPQVALNEAAERLTVAASLARRHPHLRIVFTGGESGIMARGTSAASAAAAFFEDAGVPATRLVMEPHARTTRENATLTAALPLIDRKEPWLLVTSASHMHRAVQAFRAEGWNVTPWPVDYRTPARLQWTKYSIVAGAEQWQLALHEYLGLAAYWLADSSRPAGMTLFR